MGKSCRDYDQWLDSDRVFSEIWLACATFFWGVSETIQIKVCHFYPTRTACQWASFSLHPPTD